VCRKWCMKRNRKLPILLKSKQVFQNSDMLRVMPVYDLIPIPLALPAVNSEEPFCP
jgi:hypothetical protein